MYKNSKISQIAAISEKSRALGMNGDLIWKIPEDLKRFKAITMGHPIVMGRKTFESIGRVLPGRTNIIITRNQEYKVEGAVVCHSLAETLEVAEKSAGGEEICIIGGGELFKEVLPQTDRLYLTLIHAEAPADAFFPPYPEFIKEISREEGNFGEIKYSYVTLER